MAADEKAAGSVSNTADSPAPKKPRNTSGLRPPWKKGQSGNPKGRPKNPFREAIEKAIPPEKFAATIKSKVADGDSRVIVALMDRHFPKPEVAVKLEATGPDGGPIQAHAAIEVHFVKPPDEADTP